MEARALQLSPVGPDIVAKQKGQWFCLELGQEGKKVENLRLWSHLELDVSFFQMWDIPVLKIISCAEKQHNMVTKSMAAG